MYDNKVRLSHDVLQKAEMIAAEWGLKNARAAIEAVFRRYSDEYLYGRDSGSTGAGGSPSGTFIAPPAPHASVTFSSGCAALDELDDLLGM